MYFSCPFSTQTCSLPHQLTPADQTLPAGRMPSQSSQGPQPFLSARGHLVFELWISVNLWLRRTAMMVTGGDPKRYASLEFSAAEIILFILLLKHWNKGCIGQIKLIDLIASKNPNQIIAGIGPAVRIWTNPPLSKCPAIFFARQGAWQKSPTSDLV